MKVLEALYQMQFESITLTIDLLKKLNMTSADEMLSSLDQELIQWKNNTKHILDLENLGNLEFLSITTFLGEYEEITTHKGIIYYKYTNYGGQLTSKK